MVVDRHLRMGEALERQVLSGPAALTNFVDRVISLDFRCCILMAQHALLYRCDIDWIPHKDIFGLHGLGCKEATVLLKDGQLL